jgi:hypothetical protein
VKYIARGRHGWDHRPYWRYLESVKHLMPAHVFAFAARSENHDLSSPNSLHDSWLEYWNITETTASEDRRARSIQISACLLGATHDRRIYLTYKNVAGYSVENPQEFALPPTARTGHGDLLIHELRIVRERVFAHELLFSRGTTFLVEFTEFEHCVRPMHGS